MEDVGLFSFLIRVGHSLRLTGARTLCSNVLLEYHNEARREEEKREMVSLMFGSLNVSGLALTW
jgi:hypothetical protein